MVTKIAAFPATIQSMARPHLRIFSTADRNGSGEPPSELVARPRRADEVLAQEAHGQTVLLRLADGGYYALDEVGARIWELCDGDRSLSDVITVLCSEFDAPTEMVTADVLEFVAELRAEGLLADGPAAA